MNKLFLYILLLIFSVGVLVSCDNVETYAEQKEAENKAISNFISRHGISVISEDQFHSQNDSTSVEKNEFVLFEATGVYMQIVERGCGAKLENNEGATAIVRYDEWNIMGDSIVASNNIFDYHPYPLKFKVDNRTGTFYAAFTDGSSFYGNQAVPNGWLVPLTYINLGRPMSPTDELAFVKIIVPHKEGHSQALQNVQPYYYELQYQRGN